MPAPVLGSSCEEGDLAFIVFAASLRQCLVYAADIPEDPGCLPALPGQEEGEDREDLPNAAGERTTVAPAAFPSISATCVYV